MLTKTQKYNNLSPKLEGILEKRVLSYGEVVKYRFDIEMENPDKTFYNGKTIFPQVYTLDPTVINFNDPHEDRSGVSKNKLVALISEIDDKGVPTSYKKVRVHAGVRGILTLNLDKDEDRAMCMYLELHPKNGNGLFPGKDVVAKFSRIDENAAATEKIAERSARKKAMDFAEQMSDEDVINFADAMQWDSSTNKTVLRNQIEELAENDHEFFNEFVSSNTLQYKALVKKAINKGVIAFDPAENKFTWASTNQVLTLVNCEPGKEIEKLAEWLLAGGKQAEEAYNKIKSMVSGKKEKAVA